LKTHQDGGINDDYDDTPNQGRAEVSEAEAAWIAARDANHAESAKHADLHQELYDQRRCLIHQDPELVDHLGVPVGPDNRVGAISDFSGRYRSGATCGDS
jgi:hypothetical protein